MTIDSNTVISAVAFFSAIGAAFSALFTAYRWYLKQNRQDQEIERIKEENTLICFALSACLDGLSQLGANHSVTIAKDKLDKYLNTQAHR